jgi:N-alpha-acetyltransferase 35, NatC auxiliary subunit
VTHLYNRSLLSEINSGFLELLDNAIEELEQVKTSSESKILEAITTRLKFRKCFLEALVFDAEIVSSPASTPGSPYESRWEAVIGLLPSILNTHDLGKEVKESFSLKLQRKLASTVPPRPMVELAFDVAYAHMERLAKDGNNAVKILEYKSPNNMLVSISSFEATAQADTLSSSHSSGRCNHRTQRRPYIFEHFFNHSCAMI